MSLIYFKDVEINGIFYENGVRFKKIGSALAVYLDPPYETIETLFAHSDKVEPG